MATPRELVERARTHAEEQARRAGQSAADIAYAVAEADRLASSPGYQAAVADLERREAEKRAEREREAAALEERRKEKFYGDLAERYEDRRRFYELKGVPRSVFDEVIWPKLATEFAAEGADEVDRERQAGATTPY